MACNAQKEDENDKDRTEVKASWFLKYDTNDPSDINIQFSKALQKINDKYQDEINYEINHQSDLNFGMMMHDEETSERLRQEEENENQQREESFKNMWEESKKKEADALEKEAAALMKRANELKFKYTPQNPNVNIATSP